MLFRALVCLCVGIAALASANTEKTIFLGPEPVNIPAHSTSLAALSLDTLTPHNYSVRTHLEAIFPTQDLVRGKETWLLLDSLTEVQRYEVRVCWPATVSSAPFFDSARPLPSLAPLHARMDRSSTSNQQPTAFHLTTYPLDTVFDTPALITSLYNYSMSRQTPSPSSSPPSPASALELQASVLFLRIAAAAEYFTTNATLMASPEPVLVDIILDPFVGNVLPRTLVPTVLYIVAVAVGSWVLARQVVVPTLKGLLSTEDAGKKTQ